ncbi:PREDICTED: glycerol-3-phosphate dehydrogenase 1-like protein [Amphimedon queenslandica]|uniref:Glycerol-3-phosphate dehydrogenase [NAD(+)] n=1 Tax=Amphimedon queenslandica TaxID=400682 RepID=A0A1X7TZX9_AMPQE|nr:PREDICTED: glycerol-3-phosphate dehydrogenase 1-like protein [Amphimedon queenslandica]|eukprot:XP_003389330.1 PREDICTED: glycerol-3-phosphate dehydrogenase 1-like protein [Amphimedon queenslandica]
MAAPKKVAIVGSGNWGSAISKIIGLNAQGSSNFDTTVNMWVFEEMIDGEKLSEIINTRHENVKYLPGEKLPENVVAITSVVESVKDADILIFVLPHQFVKGVCEQIKGHVKPGAFACSLIKGVDATQGGIQLVSRIIYKTLGMDVSVLMGANIASEVARGDFCESTLGSRNADNAQLLYELFHRDHFRISITQDAATVEVCGAIKNIIAIAAGFCDGLGYGSSTKAAVMRIGMMEMWQFATNYYKGVQLGTFLESCGFSDVIATCYGGRNRKVAEAFVTANKTIEELEKEMLNGQKLQGPLASYEVHQLLKKEDKEKDYPLMTAVYRICYEGAPVTDFLKMI